MLGKDDSARHLAHLMARATDALQPTGDRRRRLDLDHQVDRAHVDAELERRGRDHAAQTPALEIVFDERPLVFRHRSVMRTGEQRVGCHRRSPFDGLKSRRGRRSSARVEPCTR